MTDREPDDLYDALRDRLADYGQEPPAPLWASIRAQLPPPVAQPQLRRRRRWAPVALLALLLTIGSGAGWYWWQGHHPAGSTSGALIAISKLSQLPAQSAESPTTATASSPGSGSNTAFPKVKEPSTATTAPLPNRAHTENVGPPTSASWAAAMEQTMSQSAAASRNTRHANGVPGSGTRRFALSAAASVRRTKKVRVKGLWAAAGQEPGSSESRPLFARNRRPSSERNQTQANTKAAQFSPAAANSSPKLAKNQQDGASAAVPVLSKDASAVAGAHNQPDAGVSSPTAANGIARVPAASEQAVETNILGRLVPLQLASWPHPASPQLVAVEQLPPPVPVVDRWAVQATAGPALTYRYLPSAPAMASTTITPSGFYPVASANAVAELERPALGSGAQVSVRRTLTEHWSLSGGLGYAEYATRLALQQVRPFYTIRAGSVAPDSGNTSTSIHRRDAYRFATVPLRVGYTWAVAERWRVGVLAGADAAIYLGGSSTEGSSCACQTQTWGLTGSPYRRISLGASLGADVRYRLTGRWELLAQPTATFLLTPLAQPAAGYYPRHLFGGTALLGVSYDLP